MIPYRTVLLVLMSIALALAVPVCAGPPEPDQAARRLAARIDEQIGKKLQAARLEPLPLADDATFYRRIHLDLVGQIPRVADVRRFLDDRRLDKRERAINELLNRPGYARHFSTVWSKILLPEASSDFQARYLLPAQQNWLRQHFAANTPYDAMVRELLTVPLQRNVSPYRSLASAGAGGQATPLSFYQAKQGKPELLAASAARLFLGVRVECAQCHDDPFGKWTREDFWGLASFFAGIRPVSSIYQPLSELSDRRELAIPGTERVAQAHFLDGSRPRWKYKVGARTTLAEWMTARDNPYFSRAIVNRMWEHFFGMGLVDPVDDFRDDNPPSHPELLEELAQEFVQQDFDLRFLIRAITYSQAYQRASASSDPPGSDPHLYYRMPIKALSAEQLYDSLVEASGLTSQARQRANRLSINSPQREFLDRFDVQQDRTAPQTSIPQALAMMNSRLIADATHPDRGPTLAAVASAPFMDTEEKVETLFLAALSRKPTPREREKFVRLVEEGGATGNSRKALGDVFWALLNSTEFFFNH
jgi:hypothetical protein